MGTRSCVVIQHGEHLLMVKQLYRGNEIWTFPGGGIEVGESPEQAAIREAYEETGLIVEVTHEMMQCYSDGIQGMYYCFSGIIVGGQLRLGCDPELAGLEQELKELRWVPFDELVDHPEAKRIMPFIKARAE